MAELWPQHKWLANKQADEIMQRTSDAEKTAATAIVIAMFALAGVLLAGLAQLAALVWYLS